MLTFLVPKRTFATGKNPSTRNRRTRKLSHGLEGLENRALMAVVGLGDNGFFVPTGNESAAGGAETSLVHSYDVAGHSEQITQGSLGGKVAAADEAAKDLGFSGIGDLLHTLNPTPATPGSSSEFIFGTDDRTRVTNTLAWPYAPVGRLWMDFGGGSEAACSGVMIDTYHVLTAGHCINGVGGGGWANQAVFSAAQDGTFLSDLGTTFRRSNMQYFGEANATYFRSYTAWTQSDDWNWDIALVTLDRRVGNSTGWFGFGYNSSDNFYSSNTSTTAGYPGDLTPNDYDMWTDNGNAVNNAVTTHQLRTTDVDIFPGQSGSPIWYGGQVAHAVVSHQTWNDTNGNGVFDNGESPLYNAFTRITESKFNDLQAWRGEDDGVRAPTDRADLVDYDYWFNTSAASMSSNFTTAGGSFSITAYPRNNGTANSGNFTVSFYASTNSTISTGDYLIGSVNMGSLNPYQWGTANLNTAFPGSIPTGSYYVGWVIDSNSSVTEFNEGNNTGKVGGFLTVGADDHGNNAATSTRIFSDSTPNGNLETAGDKDWFVFEASAGAQVTLGTTLGTLGDSLIRLFSSNGTTQIAFDDDSGPGLASLLNYTIPTYGTYYLSVEEFGNDAAGSYSLSLTHADDFGDTAASAALISGESVTQGDLEVGGDTDWFAFSAMAGAEMSFETQLNSLPDSILRLYDSDGVTELAVDDDSGAGFASRIDFIAPHAGIYYIRVEEFGTPSPGTYQLNFHFTDDHGNSPNAATAVGTSSVTNGAIEVYPDGDVFSFVATPGTSYVLETTLQTLADSTLSLLGTDGVTLLDFNDDIDLFNGNLASRINFTAASGGTYYLIVAGFNSNVGTYQLNIQTVGGMIDGDFNDDLAYNCADVDALTAAIAAGTNNPNYDLTGDALVNSSDRDAWLAEAGAANLPSTNPYRLGDANLDGVVDGSDFGIWNSNKFTATPAWCSGDFTADGVVDGSDFGVWNANKFTSSDSARNAGSTLSIKDLASVKAPTSLSAKRVDLAFDAISKHVAPSLPSNSRFDTTMSLLSSPSTENARIKEKTTPAGRRSQGSHGSILDLAISEMLNS